MKTTPFLILTLLVALHLLVPLGAQDPAAQDPAADPQVTLERAAYAEEYERDLERAEALYTLAIALAKTEGDEATAKAAAAALARVQARRAGGPAVTAGQLDEAIVERIGELLVGLSQIPLGIDNESPQWANYEAITTDLAVYGDAVVPYLEALLEPTTIEIEAWRVQLDTRMAARRLARLDTDSANAALARALQARDPLIRRAVAEELSSFRHRSLLEQAARDAVPQVRSVAVGSLLHLRETELLGVVEPEALAGNRNAVQWMVEVTPERVLALLEEVDLEPAFVTYATARIYRAELPATEQVVEVLLRLARDLKEEEWRVQVLAAMEKYFGRTGPWSQAPRALRDQIQERLLAEPERYPRQAAFELLAKIGNFETFEYLSRELTRWPAERSQQDTQWLHDATRSLGEKTGPEDFDRLATLYRELPTNPAVPAATLPLWHGEALTRLAALANKNTIPADSLVRGFAGLAGVRRTSYFFVIRNWMDRFSASPGPGAEIEPLLSILREMLDEEDSGDNHVEAAMRGLAAAGDFESLPRILEKRYSSSTQQNSRLRQAARNAVESFYYQDPDRTTEVVVATILTSGVGPQSIQSLTAPRDLAAFQRVWPELEDEGRRAEALSILVKYIDGDAVVAQLYSHMKVPDTKKRAIQRFGLHLYEPAIPILGLALEDPSSSVREEARAAFHAFQEHREALEEFAAWTLGDRQARQQIDELIALLDSPDDAVVLGAIQALGVVRARAALPALVRLLAKDDPGTQAAVHEAIERIGN